VKWCLYVRHEIVLAMNCRIFTLYLYVEKKYLVDNLFQFQKRELKTLNKICVYVVFPSTNHQLKSGNHARIYIYFVSLIKGAISIYSSFNLFKKPKCVTKINKNDIFFVCQNKILRKCANLFFNMWSMILVRCIFVLPFFMYCWYLIFSIKIVL
jgi:hypothetical protein